MLPCRWEFRERSCGNIDGNVTRCYVIKWNSLVHVQFNKITNTIYRSIAITDSVELIGRLVADRIGILRGTSLSKKFASSVYLFGENLIKNSNINMSIKIALLKHF